MKEITDFAGELRLRHRKEPTMVLSTQTDNLFHRFGADRAIPIFAEAGFDAIDYSMFAMTGDDCPLNTVDPEKYGNELRKKAEAAGLFFNQAHAPFPGWRAGDEAYNAKMPGRIAQSIRIAGVLGAKAIVVHPIAYTVGGEEQKRVNFEYYRALAPVAKEYGIKIALENMWGYDGRRGYIMPNVCSFGQDLAEYYDELADPDVYTVCLDLGHCGLVGDEPDAAIRVLGHDRLGALHVHDNNYKADNHTVPYDYGMKMNWDAITKALGEIDYKGDFTFEADAFLGRFDEETVPAAVNFMAAIGRRLIAKIEKARTK